jgi:hypothetical protein
VAGRAQEELIADLIRDTFRRDKYQDVILPLLPEASGK